MNLVSSIKRMIPKPMAAILAFLAGFVLVAGAVSCGANTYATRSPGSNVELDRMVTDPGLASEVKVVAANLTKAAGQPAAQIVVRNLGGASRNIEVKFTWRDEGGVDRTPNLNTWRPYTLGPGEEQSITSVGGGWASDFTVMIRSRQ